MDKMDDPRARRPSTSTGNGRIRVREAYEAPISVLLKRLTDDAGLLLREEVDLAKSELRDSAKRMGQAAAKMGLALGLALPGMLAITAFLVIALGDALNNYWLGALIVGAVFLALAAILARRAMAQVDEGKRAVTQTAETLREDAEWARAEVQAFKRELRA